MRGTDLDEASLDRIHVESSKRIAYRYLGLSFVLGSIGIIYHYINGEGTLYNALFHGKGDITRDKIDLTLLRKNVTKVLYDTYVTIVMKQNYSEFITIISNNKLLFSFIFFVLFMSIYMFYENNYGSSVKSVHI